MKKVIFLFGSLFLYSCANLSSIQDGRALKKNTVEITPMVSLGKFKSFTQNTNKNEESEFNYIPVFGTRVKYGITDKFDAGINVDLATNFGLTGKYQFIGNQQKKLNASIGLDFGANLIGLGYDKLFYYYSIPLYLSYNKNENFTTFVTPRFMHNSEYVFREKYSNESVGQKFNFSRIAISYGILLGKKNKYGFEITHGTSEILKPTTISFGYNFRL